MPTITMPAPVAAYIAAKQAGDHSATVATFSPDAVVVDEGVERRGADAIGRWLEEVSTAFRPSYEVVDVAAVGDRTVVAVRVAGDFPGSPLTMYFLFTLRDDRIAALTIVP
jgi:ketosteroid isomerase-like protein